MVSKSPSSASFQQLNPFRRRKDKSFLHAEKPQEATDKAGSYQSSQMEKGGEQE